jgi:hypothetical protein
MYARILKSNFDHDSAFLLPLKWKVLLSRLNLSFAFFGHKAVKCRTIVLNGFVVALDPECQAIGENCLTLLASPVLGKANEWGANE